MIQARLWDVLNCWYWRTSFLYLWFVKRKIGILDLGRKRNMSLFIIFFSYQFLRQISSTESQSLGLLVVFVCPSWYWWTSFLYLWFVKRKIDILDLGRKRNMSLFIIFVSYQFLRQISSTESQSLGLLVVFVCLSKLLFQFSFFL